MNRWMMRAAAVMAIALFTACDADPMGGVAVDRVEVGPANQTVAVGDSAELTAVPYGAGGDVVPGVVLWRSLNPAVASVRASGGKAIVVAKAPGVARIEAESGGRLGHVYVTVASVAQVASVEVLVTGPVVVGQTLSVRAVGRTMSGQEIPNRPVVWSIEPGTVAALTANPGGWATVVGLSEGEAVVRATIDGIIGEARVQVVTTVPTPAQVAQVTITPSGFSLPVNHETPLQAIAKDANGDIIVGLPVTWMSTDEAIATVTPIGTSPFASLLAKSAGTVKIRATVGGVTGEVSIQVTGTTQPAPEILYLHFSTLRRGIYTQHSIDLKPQLIAVGRNGVVPTPTATWSVADETIATVDASGNLRGVRAGTTIVHATIGTLTAAVQVTVYAQPTLPATYDLTFDWWDGGWRMAPAVGTQTWTDASGADHQITLWLTGGSLTLTADDRYVRRLQVSGWALVNGVNTMVIQRDLVDEGSVGIIVGGETGYSMHSSTTPGYVWTVLGWREAGHLRMRTAIGTAAATDYLLRIRQ